MAMNLGSSSGNAGRQGADPELMMEINTTPLIDVMLVLLIMLIITIPVQLHSVNLNMPAGHPPPPLKEPVVVTIDVAADGTILWNGEALPTRAALEAKLQTAAIQPDQPEIHLRPNKSVEYKYVAEVLAESQRLGIKKLGMVGNEQFAR